MSETLTWNRRVVHSTEGGDFYQIHEVYYNKAGEIEMTTKCAIAPGGETIEELIEELRDMLLEAESCRQRPTEKILEAADLPGN